MNQLQFSIVCEAVTVYIVPHNMNLFIFIVGLLCTVWETSAQYYYISAGQPALFQFRTNYNPFPQQFSTYHGNQQYSTFHGNQQFVRAQVPVTQPTYIGGRAAPVPPVQRQNDVPEYRGFAYQTTSDNNAVSHVLFVSGPESQKFTSSVFSSITSPQNVEIEKARSIASDLVDPIKNDEYNSVGEDYILPKKIEKSFSNFFHSPGSFSSVVNLYSSPKAGLFARPVSGYPANTFPLQVPPTNSLFTLLGSNLETEMTTTSKSITANDDDTVVIDNAEAQESVMTNTRFRLNNFAEPKGKSLELSAPDKVTEKNEFMEDISISTEGSTKSLELTGTTTPVTEFELIVTETVQGTTMTEITGNTIGEPVETTDKSVPTTNESVKVLDKAVQTSAQSVESTSQVAQIMDQSVQTTDEYISTTVQSIPTTVQSIPTTIQSSQTTVQSSQTTVQSIQTTVQSIPTTVQSIQTTVQATEATAQFAQTTEQSPQTTDQSAQTRDQSTETTGQFVTTTDQSVQTTVQSIQTTNQADQTTVKAETTAANLDKGTITTEKTGTTARIMTTTIV